MKYKQVFRYAAGVLLALVIAACGGGGGGGIPLQGSGGDNDGPGGQSPVTVTITWPASAANMETPDESVILEGTADSANEILSVEWSSDRGGQGTASGTSSWKTGGIPLELGENRITVTAKDHSGRTASRTAVIKRETAGTGSVELSWTAPTQREDGSALDNLAGFNIYYGRMSGIYDFRVKITNPGITTYVVEGLKPGDWFFVVSAFDTDGVESNFSNEVKRVVE